MKKIFILALFVSLILFSCKNIDMDPIRIGVNAWPPCELWYIAKEQGFFGDTPVEIVRFSSWYDNMSSLYKGKIDLTHSTYFNAAYFNRRGRKGVIILSSDTIVGGDGFCLTKELAKSMDLNGKKIAVEVNTDEHFLLYKALERFGFSLSDIKIVPTTSKEAMQMFIEGAVDGCFTYEPYLSLAKEKGEGEIVFTTSELKGYMIDSLVADEETLNERNKDFLNVIKSWYKAREYVKLNPKESFALMAKNEDISLKDFETFYSSFTFYSLEDNIQIFNSSEFRGRLNEIIDFLYDKGIIEEKFAPSEIYRSSIVSEIRD